MVKECYCERGFGMNLEWNEQKISVWFWQCEVLSCGGLSRLTDPQMFPASRRRSVCSVVSPPSGHLETKLSISIDGL